MDPVGIVGIGRLGSAVAQRLLQAGFEVAGYDPDSARTLWLEQAGGRAATPSEIALTCRRIVLALPSHEVVLSTLAGFRPATIVIDTTNATPAQSEKAATDLHLRGVAYLDAPVCDWHETVRTEGGKVVCGGDESAVAACRDIFDAFARPFIHAGPSGAGSRMKAELEQNKS